MSNASVKRQVSGILHIIMVRMEASLLTGVYLNLLLSSLHLNLG